MEICPYCNKMTAQKDLYTGEIICYDKMCYEAGGNVGPATADEYQEAGERLKKYREELLKKADDMYQRLYGQEEEK